MRPWIGAFGVLQLFLITASCLLIPTAVGLAVDLKYGTAPWAVLAGALIGIAVATAGITRLMLRRYDDLAPRSSTPGADKQWPD